MPHILGHFYFISRLQGDNTLDLWKENYTKMEVLVSSLRMARQYRIPLWNPYKILKQYSSWNDSSRWNDIPTQQSMRLLLMFNHLNNFLAYGRNSTTKQLHAISHRYWAGDKNSERHHAKHDCTISLSWESQKWIQGVAEETGERSINIHQTHHPLFGESNNFLLFYGTRSYRTSYLW